MTPVVLAGRRCALTLALVLVLAGGAGLVPAPIPASAQSAPGDTRSTPGEARVAPGGTTGTPASTVPEPVVTALGAVVYDPAADRVLWGRRQDAGIPMASTTKIMTTLLALEAGTVDDIVTVSRRAAQMGGAGLGLHLGERIPMRSLLKGLMLRSGNDAATAVAEHVAGDEAAFVRRMNARARELGLRDTRFVNASGLTDDRTHRASPLDLARLTDVAMRHSDFAAWAAARRLDVPGLGLLDNRNELIGRYPGANGVKTGYLAHAGFALVASATREGLTLYAVVLGSDDSFADARRLFDWGFARYRLAQPAAEGTPVGVYRWADSEVAMHAAAPVAAAVRRDATVRWRVRPLPAVARPVAAGARLGEASLVEDGAVVAAVPLRAAGPVGAPSAPAGGAVAGGPGEGTTETASGRTAHEAGRAVHEALRQFARLHAADAEA